MEPFISMIAMIISGGAAYFSFRQAENAIKISKQATRARIDHELFEWSSDVISNFVDAYGFVNQAENENENGFGVEVYKCFLVQRDKGSILFADSYSEQNSIVSLNCIQKTANLMQQFIQDPKCIYVIEDDKKKPVLTRENTRGAIMFRNFILEERKKFVEDMRDTIKTRELSRELTQK